jgi:hypothetical protein
MAAGERPFSFPDKPKGISMKINLYLSLAQVACFANDNDAYIPEHWAQEGLAILEENMVIANLVHRDFEDEVKDFGDVVNTRRPGTFQIRRKADGTTLSQQDANATNVRVPLDQWFYTSFTIKDGEASKAFQDLVDIYLRPGMQTIARGVDRAILGRAHAFLGTPASRVGRLGNLTSANSKDYLLEARERLNINKAPVAGRNLVLAPASETALLKNDMFIKANERGDGGSALENAQLGHILGFETYMDQNVNSIQALNTDHVEGAISNASGYAAGKTGELAVTGFTGAVVTGEYVTVAGNDQPTWVSAHTETVADTTGITLNEPLKYAVADGAVVARFKACDVKGAYAAGYAKEIVLDGWAVAPQVGQMVAFGTATRHVYTIIESWQSAAGEQSVILDRPLDYAVADDAKAFPGPAGALNMAFHRDALALVTRPLAVPNNAMGVLSHVGAYNNIAMRVSMQYDIQEGGTVVNLDILAGVAVLDPSLCVVMLG